MLLSIIVVAYNNADYIEQAIHSCLSSDDADCELIVVHNCSMDRTGEIIRETAEGWNAPFRIISNDRNVGPGAARNIGMQHASGDYLMFLDGDDWFELGAISRIVACLRQWSPDILMFNHQRIWSDGRKIPNTPNRYVDLRDEPVDLADPGVRRGAIRNLHISWNKAYKRGFVEDIGLEFPPLVYYEDLLWSIKAMVCAGSCRFIPDILYNYRQHQKSSIQTRDEGHFGVIGQCGLVRNFLEDHEDYRRWYGRELYGYVRSTLLGVINTRRRIPEDREDTYLKATAELLNEFRRMLGLRRPDPLLIAAALGSGVYRPVSAWTARADRLSRLAYRMKKGLAGRTVGKQMNGRV
ncbi:Glycosyl transferase, family 2 OS=Castellaniella defragrans (strain DSM / CCUG 39792 / 65Phen)OX=1437824 GN=BN940_10701 PE=4 SV=1 [Castellaniella denitrificans]